eukprot:3395583-Amphidinium_carterae.2
MTHSLGHEASLPEGACLSQVVVARQTIVMINIINMIQCMLGSFRASRTISSINNARLVMFGRVTKLVNNQ